MSAGPDMPWSSSHLCHKVRWLLPAPAGAAPLPPWGSKGTLTGLRRPGPRVAELGAMEKATDGRRGSSLCCRMGVTTRHDSQAGGKTGQDRSWAAARGCGHGSVTGPSDQRWTARPPGGPGHPAPGPRGGCLWVSAQGWGVSSGGSRGVGGRKGQALAAHLSWAREAASHWGSAPPPRERSGGRWSPPPGQPEAEEQDGPSQGESRGPAVPSGCRGALPDFSAELLAGTGSHTGLVSLSIYFSDFIFQLCLHPVWGSNAQP